ncbi:hypothetical protein SLEP1_g20148 [Rubroshorea leprosula]|uniref:Uncharacterized protein n=1 Tax=Rubroshorea leprosula TaxID=152421 RepID=A0AAV5J7L5_9ROSI|nr:hypothetical protein SLEP1_g20148 [Rubroshorea leprosula]
MSGERDENLVMDIVDISKRLVTRDRTLKPLSCLAIASMVHAQEADPTNLEVLLALGVSHTNGLEQTAALKYPY